ncbi:hypothetical protein GUITHDRAFT_151855 [Guillardia theta CCMP2712]|uniref:Uncharacterized protein n=1 Tax=Guillardia theta (strain CCMP2712) TaxID=905079 RepID=L1JJR3_GUITC|nr:hypothetical protein GUITHDRAFT_151855 [Guillardia theta CCMP2712]EKX48305.1 hypothetical protein GUITHDRAFT_151855 [Guillardia theta CCMP2712]|eukprot:XP_005835285.1 hypothetical protein GUITHDRAFT_151855 [Guillardia theta CCMP2712]
MAFGVAWLVFIDSIIQYNTCLDRVNVDDICAWGKPPNNQTIAHASDRNVLLMTTPAPPQWPAITGRPALVYLPGVLGAVALFMVNTVEPYQLSMSYAEMVEGASPTALKIWLFVGMLAGLTSIILSVWVLLDVYMRDPALHHEPAIAAIVQSVFIFVSSGIFWVGRSYGEDDLWGSDPLL